MKWKFLSPQAEHSFEEYQRLQSELKELGTKTGLNLLAAQVCWNRGLRDSESILEFISPKLEKLTHPFKILDLEKAAKHIFEAHQAGKRIRVFTDYDVDGTAGAALLTWFFRDMKFNFDVVQPDRFKDGYGLNVGAVEQAVQDQVDTLITVDCGVTNFAAIERAAELGLHVVIVDHHQIDPVRGLPPAFAVIDPQRSDDVSNLKQVCGCGLAFYLAMGIRSVARLDGYFEKQQIPEPNLKNLLDLVVIATAADMVPLTGDNRILVKHGMDVLKKTQKPGLRAMMECSGIDLQKVSPSNLGFVLGPRINASGRLGSAKTAYECLTTQDEFQAQNLAKELEEINSSRAELQNGIWDQVRNWLEPRIKEPRFSHALVVASPEWHEGVVGIVASRVTEHFKKPAIVMAIREDGIVKGSVRSYKGIDALSALHQCKDLLKSYGGHKMAAGVSLLKDQFDEFQIQFNEEIKKIIEEDLAKHPEPELKIDGECTLSAMTVSVLEELEQLGPFGPGNPEPVFACQAFISTQTVIKGRHLKLMLTDGAGVNLESIWFNAAERQEWMEIAEKNSQQRKMLKFAGIPEVNRFRGRAKPTVRLKSVQENP